MSEQASSPGSGMIFRQSALDRLSSPERIDRVITITAPRDWLAFATLAAMLAVGVAWSFYGSVPTKVSGSGILIATGGRVFEAFSSSDGVVSEIAVKEGDIVAEGDLIASIAQPNLALELRNARLFATERQIQVENRLRQVELFTKLRQQNIESRKRAIEERMHGAGERLAASEARLADEERMFKERLITWQRLQESRREVATSREVVFDARSQIIQVDTEELSAQHADERDLQNAKDILADSQRQISQLELQLQQSDRALSPAAGRVTEIKAAIGSRATPGMPIVSIESGVTGLQLIVYMSPDQGKQVKPGMDVRIAPSTVKREEYGTLVGTVLEVSEFPATAQAMLAVLGNERLVEQFSLSGAPIAARIDLEQDSETPSGYRWSGGKGPPATLSSGTIARAEVTVREVPPISFVIPMLRGLSGTNG